MRCSEIINILEELAPHRMACEWDNPGLLAGRKEKEVKKLLLCVDADDEAVALAVRQGADMIVSHHPLIFRSIKRVTDEDFIGRRLVEMIQSDLSCFAMHTNFDSAPGCMADLAAERIGICGGEPLEAMGEENGVLYGIGKTGSLKTPVTGMELARRVKETFGLPFVTVYGEGLWEKELVVRAAVCPGSGDSTIQAALEKGAQALITGDIGHHPGNDHCFRLSGRQLFQSIGEPGLDPVFQTRHGHRFLCPGQRAFPHVHGQGPLYGPPSHQLHRHMAVVCADICRRLCRPYHGNHRFQTV